MNKKNLKVKISIFIFWSILIISFVFFAVFIQVKANGWKFNYQTLQITKTGMISLDGIPEVARVEINGKVYSQTLPTKIRNLSPGYYDISISSLTYQSWQKTVQVQQEKVNLFQSIVLFSEKPTEAVVPTDVNADLIKNEYNTKSVDVKINGSELFYKDKIVSRFGQNILRAIIYPDENHIIFQQADEIRVIDLDGSNDKLLMKLTSTEPTFFTIKNSGKTLYYVDQGVIYGRTIN